MGFFALFFFPDAQMGERSRKELQLLHNAAELDPVECVKSQRGIVSFFTASAGTLNKPHLALGFLFNWIHPLGTIYADHKLLLVYTLFYLDEAGVR